jgi:RNA polymerase sigma factor (sigma-70 family)
MSDSYIDDHFHVAILANQHHPYHNDLWKEWHALVARFVYKETREWFYATPADLEDLTQIVLAEVATNLVHFTYQSSFRTWVYSITVKQVINIVRMQSAQKRSAQITSIEDIAATIPHPSADKLEQMAVIAELRRIYVDRLQRETDSRLATILVLAEAYDLHPNEIADRLGLSASHLRALLQQAKKIVQSDPNMLAWLRAYRDQEPEA